MEWFKFRLRIFNQGLFSGVYFSHIRHQITNLRAIYMPNILKPRSLTARLMLMTSLLVITCSITAALVIHHYAEQSQLERTIEVFTSQSEAISLDAIGSVEDFRDDVLILASTLPINRVLMSEEVPKNFYENATWKEELASLMLSMAKIKDRYQQIRFISAFDNGHEVLRVERQGGQVREVTVDLQEKGGRSYFQNTARLSTGEVYFSPINLNRDFGKVTYPKIKTFRVATPVVRKGKFIGMFIININIGNVFEQLKKNISNKQTILLTNQKGYYLLHPDESKEFSWEFNRESTIIQDYPALTEFFNSSDTTRVTRIVGAGEGKKLIHALKVPVNPDDEKNSDFIVSAISLPYAEVESSAREIRTYSLSIGAIFALLGTIASWFIAKKLTTPLIDLKERINSFAAGGENVQLPEIDDHEISDVIKAFNTMARQRAEEEKKVQQYSESLKWLRDSSLKLNDKIIGRTDPKELATSILEHFTQLFNLHSAVIYSKNMAGVFNLVASYARFNNIYGIDKDDPGQLLRQASVDHKVIYLKNVPSDYPKVTSALGQALPSELMVVPIVYSGECLAILELASLHGFEKRSVEFINECIEPVAISFNLAISNLKLKSLLEETQAQSEELQTQQEELQSQQAELEVSNQELEEQKQAIEIQKNIIQEKNIDLEKVKETLEVNAQELKQSSEYKSQFLANMSHELRTPLNSLLILTSLLQDNSDKNLTTEQISSLASIKSSGEDLLRLINDILDLSKVEAGHLECRPEKVLLHSFFEMFLNSISPLAVDKGIPLELKLSDAIPDSIVTDRQRLEQILNNLVSNAIKFTNEGSVKITVDMENPEMLSIAITDTGIGIKEEDLEYIFDSFKQVDQTDSRIHGGTGLGLAISRELAKMLEGSLRASSTPGAGSVFTLSLPTSLANASDVNASSPVFATAKKNDDREVLQPDQLLLLVIESDQEFAKFVIQLGREKDFQVVHSLTGMAGCSDAEKYMPDGIILDSQLVDISGSEVLAKLKANPNTSGIPVHLVSSSADSRQKPMTLESIGASLDEFVKSAEVDSKTVLVVEDNVEQRSAIIALLERSGVRVLEAGTIKDAENILCNDKIDCMVLDLNLEGESGYSILESVSNDSSVHLPSVIIYTGQDLTKDDEEKLKQYTDSVIIKGEKSSDRLLDEVKLFLHRTQREKFNSGTTVADTSGANHHELIGANVLLVDDDMRNVFAVSSVLEKYGMNVSVARSGKEALQKLSDNSSPDVVLMDIMMPEMDGIEATRKIRQMASHEDLPIIALTAKVAKGDRETCLQAGCNDFLTKPIDIDSLLSILGVWVQR